MLRSQGNYLKEWLKAVAVYVSSALVATLLPPVIVIVLRAVTPMYEDAPYVGAALLIVATPLFNFFAQEEFSFKSR